jgi:hypothetical protein
MTARDAAANSVLALASLDVPRQTLEVLPAPAPSPVLKMANVPHPTDAIGAGPVQVTRPDDSVNAGSLPNILQSAMRQDIMMSPNDKAQILRAVAKITTRGQAMEYMKTVQTKIRAARSAAP